ncbi:MAG: hypothetical protein ABSG25_02360 [Bryobacteraceae bacterium]
MPSTFAEGLAVKAPLQNIGMLQNTYIWKVLIPYIPFVGPALNLTFLVTSTTIPETKSGSTIIRPQGMVEYIIPNRKEYPHDWTLTLYMPEIDATFKQLATWYHLIDTVDIKLLKTTATLTLLSLNGTTATKVIVLQGVYPSNYPAIDNLDYNQTTGFITGAFTFNFDSLSVDGFSL